MCFRWYFLGVVGKKNTIFAFFHQSSFILLIRKRSVKIGLKSPKKTLNFCVNIEIGNLTSFDASGEWFAITSRIFWFLLNLPKSSSEKSNIAEVS